MGYIEKGVEIMTDVMQKILENFNAGKKVRTCIQFGTVQGCFIVESIEPKENDYEWIFRGGTFQLSTGRYKFLREEKTNEGIQYIFAPKLETHPKKMICFEIIEK